MGKNEINIIQAGENSIEFGQTSKGFWYCKNAVISCCSIIDAIELMDRSIDKINQVLIEKNSGKGE
jgi:hypothetical protein